MCRSFVVGQDDEERDERGEVDAPQHAVRGLRGRRPTSRRRTTRAGTRRTTTSRSRAGHLGAMRSASVRKPVTAITRNVTRITASSGLVLMRMRYGPLEVAAADRPEDADDEHDAREVGGERVALVHAAVQELQVVGELVVDLEHHRGDEQPEEPEVDARSASAPAAGSRSSVCIQTPARKSRMRRCTLPLVVRRSSGLPRS